MACEAQRDLVNQKIATLQNELAQRSKELGEKFREQAKDIDPDIDTTGPDVWVGADVEITWKTVELSLDLPEVTIRDQEWSLDLPQVTVNDQHISFDLPATRMETQKVGEYPEFYCDTSKFPPQCTVRWSPIYADVPVFYMERQDIVLGVPEFRMDRTSFILGVPEFTMKTVKFALDLPQITVKNIQVEAEEARTRANELSARAKTESDALKTKFQEEAKMNVGFDVNGMFDCFQSELQSRKNDAVAMFESGQASIRAGIDAMVTRKVPEDNESLKRLRAQLTELVSKSEEFAASIAKQFADLDEQRRSFVKNLLGE